MKRYFGVTVQFNLKNEKVVDYLTKYFSFDMDDEGVVEIRHEGNIKSSEKSAINGVKQSLNYFEPFKRNFKILAVREM